MRERLALLRARVPAAFHRALPLLVALLFLISALNTVLLVSLLADDASEHATVPAVPSLKVLVPDLSSMPLREAVEMLDEAGLHLGRLFDGASPEAEPEAVLGQSPAAGSWSLTGSEVHLVVSAGRLGLVMPDLADTMTGEAIRVLAAEDLRPVISLERCPWAPSGTVLAQLPEAGTMLLPGQEVHLRVSGDREPHSCWDCGGAGSVTCPYCQGKLQRPVAEERGCDACEASGILLCETCEGFGSYVDVCSNCEGWGCKACDWRGTVTVACEACGGEGAVACPACDGFGSVISWEMKPCRECRNGVAGCLTCGGDGWASW